MILGAATPRHRLPMVLSGVVCVGIVVLVVGTFLPWLVSGRVNRSSYAATGALRTLLHLHGVLGVGLRIWPFVSLAGALAVALIVLGRTGIGGGLALLTAIVAGTVAAAALSNTSSGLIHVATSGPAVTLTGSALSAAGVVAYFGQRLVTPRSTT